LDPAYIQYHDLAGAVTPISNNTVPVGLKPNPIGEREPFGEPELVRKLSGGTHLMRVCELA
jgi:hypothetical protein